ncbi:MAG: class I SAM-dependent methyltransferase [Paludibacter sp.]|jgi:ubiquinone/menaquinone biosynthesis C-methylase UbiE|nr:class I SAM-dependent methyltransferase [Paludibacter sp.]
MKVRDSGMPDEKLWNDFFDTDLILSELQINSQINNLVEIGSGYGTFTIPTARFLKGKLFAFDIESDMIDYLSEKLSNHKIDNVILEQRDILTQTTGLADNSVDYVMLFNILHHDSPTDFLDESFRILKQNGKIGIIHWRSDISTPRGPDLSIRPKSDQIIEMIDNKRFNIAKKPFLLEPYHYGLVITKI